MNKIKLLIAFLASVSLLIGCGQQAEIDSTGTESSEQEPADMSESSEDMSADSEEVELIPVAVWTEIDVNQAGQVSSAEFVEYYLVKAEDEEKLTEEDAQKKFQNLDQDADGQLTKQEATGEN